MAYKFEKYSIGGGGSKAIIDVDALPTENINTEAFYRLFTVYGFYDGVVQEGKVYIVDTLPASGEPATEDGETFANGYYNKTDGGVYGYVNSTLSSALGVPEGWYPAENLVTALGLNYGGVIDSEAEGTAEYTFYFVRGYALYSYKNDWEEVKGIGWRGTGYGGEIFNSAFNVASGAYSHVEGHDTTASGNHSHAEGEEATASGYSSHAEGLRTTASGDYGSHAEGQNTTASGYSSHAEGYQTTASSEYSHAEGCLTTASGDYGSHAEGQDTTASGDNSHAEGYKTIASGDYSHAECNRATASGAYSHAEGYGTTASSSSSHAEGYQTTASGDDSHAEGYKTIASGNAQHVQGKRNIEDTENKYAHIVGNGASDTARSNAHTLDWSGNAWFAGTVEGTAIILKSSTGSGKRFKITVNDSGTLTATEITA